MHGLLHLAPDTIRLGPGAYCSQWTLERTIGNLGEEIKQPSNPYANLANCGLCHSQTAALHAMLLELVVTTPDSPILPRGAIDIRDGYALLRAQDESAVILEGEEARAIHTFMGNNLEQSNLPADWQPRIIQWACLQLPNLQVACCARKETARVSAAKCVCCSHNVRVSSLTVLNM